MDEWQAGWRMDALQAFWGYEYIVKIPGFRKGRCFDGVDSIGRMDLMLFFSFSFSFSFFEWYGGPAEFSLLVY